MPRCNTCANCDIGPCLGPGHKPTAFGWCTPRSLYPAFTATDQPDIPSTAVRAAAGQMAKPRVVNLAMDGESCHMYVQGAPHGPSQLPDVNTRKGLRR